MEPKKRRSDLEQILAVTIIVISCFFVFTYLLTAVVGPLAFFFTPEGVETSVKPLKNGLLVWFFVVIFFYIPVMPNVGEVFLFLAGVFFFCLLTAWWFRESFHNAIRKGSSRPAHENFNNFLAAMPIITCMLFIAVLAITSLQSAVGVPTTPPREMEEQLPFIQFFEVSYAVLVEEIGFRLSPIGLFLIIRMFIARAQNRIALSRWRRLKLFFASFLYPEGAKKMVGLKTVSEFGIRGGISDNEWGMILATSCAWGLAHYLFGWSIGKVTPVIAIGLVSGLIYIAYGAYAPILLHWFFNYYFWVLGSSLDYYPYLLPISAIAIILMFVVGIGGWIIFAIVGVKRVVGKFRAKPSMPLPLPPPPLPPPPPPD